VRRGTGDLQLKYLLKPNHIDNLRQSPAYGEYLKELTEFENRLRAQY
jgi:hypothetical protein